MRIQEISPNGAIHLYAAAFPDEDLVPLVTSLHRDDAATIFTAMDGEVILGQCIYSSCSVKDGPTTIALLGPLAVHPDHQRRGVGTALIRHGLGKMRDRGAVVVTVLGDPAYYHRFGFQPETRIAPPYPIPDEWRDAWRSVHFSEIASSPFGTLVPPEPWCDRALWSP